MVDFLPQFQDEQFDGNTMCFPMSPYAEKCEDVIITGDDMFAIALGVDVELLDKLYIKYTRALYKMPDVTWVAGCEGHKVQVIIAFTPSIAYRVIMTKEDTIQCTADNQHRRMGFRAINRKTGLALNVTFKGLHLVSP